MRHQSGRYYAYLFMDGREIWKSLKTEHLSVAQAKLTELLKEHRQMKGKEIDPTNAKMTFGQAAKLDQARPGEPR